MTRAANWNTRWNVQKQHIVWRETFYEVKFNVLQKAYAHFRMLFANKDTIIGANCVLTDHVNKYGTVDGFREALGESKYTDKNKAYFHQLTDMKKFGAWLIRVPFLLVALVFVIVREISDLCVNGLQKLIVMLPGSVE